MHYSLTSLSLAYLSLPTFDQGMNEEDVVAALEIGTYAFYDYASACWAVHLQSGIQDLCEGEEFNDLLDTIEPFINLHWASNPKLLKVSAKLQASLSSIKAKAPAELYARISQAIVWSIKQLGEECENPSEDEALDLWQVTGKIRSGIEGVNPPLLSDINQHTFRQFYGSNRFKCPRISCYYYHEGFSTARDREKHIGRHDRPFLCSIEGCHLMIFGCATADELKKHFLGYHGIDDAYDGREYPAPPKPQVHSNSKSKGTFRCDLCPERTWTTKYNRDAHIRSHSKIKPFECSVCRVTFTRDSDCKRHEKGHGDVKFTCSGILMDGFTWGCGKSFPRADKRTKHFQEKGRDCIRPLLQEKLKEKGELADGQDMFGTLDADAVLAGKTLPSFHEVLKLCGLA